MTTSHTGTTFESRLWFTGFLLRTLGVGAIAGVAAGIIAGGLGSRLAMRISAYATGPSCADLITENGNRCGDITLNGTMALLIFGGVFTGIVGGAVYTVLKPWIADLGRWKGVALGLVLLAVFGSDIIEAGNVDFHLFATPLLNVILFVVLFPLFGYLAVFFTDRLERLVPLGPLGRPVRVRAILTYALAALVGAFTLFIVMAFGTGPSGIIGGLLIYLVLALPAARWLMELAQKEDHSGSGPLRRRPLWATGYAVLALPIGIGLFFTLREVVEIFAA